MSKIVFFGIPAHGHTNPTLGVVSELVSRGHQVWYYSYNMMREKIESSGATFVSCDEYDAEIKTNTKTSEKVGKDLAYSTKLLVDTTLAIDDKLCAEMLKLKPDCIVADSMALWGKAIAMKLDIPFVSSTTTFAFNQYSAKVMKQSAVDLLRMLISLPAVSKQVKRLKDKGYPVNNILDIIGSDNDAHTIVFTSPDFQPFSETFSDKYAFVGPSVRTATDIIEKTSEKLIYISMGTVNNKMLSLYKKCIKSFEKSDYQVIISVGNSISIEEFGKLPGNISIYPQVDQIAVLEKADAFISHCGMNSVSESLYYGVPLIMVPQTSEQKGVAERVFELGAGIKLEKINVNSIYGSVIKIFEDDTYKNNATEISRDFKKCLGAVGAADKILKVCNKIN